MEDILRVEGLTKHYRQGKALDGVDMRVRRGAIYGLVGRNGAGKTTLIRVICGLQRPTAGGYALFGRPHTARDIARSRRRMGAIVETPSIYLDMTARENIRAQYRVLGRPSLDGVDALLDLVRLGDAGNKRAKHFSLGMKQRLGIAVALAGDPDFLVLDEPVNGLDPQGIVEMRELILALNRERGITVLLSSHMLDELARLATRYGFLDGGRLIQEIGAEDLARSCRKCTRLAVTNLPALARALDGMGIEYAVTSEREADVYGSWNMTQLAIRLGEQGCEITGVATRDESLESYYINLTGGGARA